MHLHILGIAGSMTAPLAVALKKRGHTVTGSDQDKIYPPFSTQLKNSNIPVNKTEITNKIDLAIIGSSYKSFAKTRREFVRLKELKIPYISATKYIAKNLIKKDSIIVAGSFGKTTITAATVFCLQKHGLDPSFMFGGQAKNDLPSLSFGNTSWSVVEGDESINGQDTMAKFLYYPVKYLIITSADWEHRDSYATSEDNLAAFKNLISKVPKDGLIIYNPHNKNLKKIIKYAQAPSFPYHPFSQKICLIGEHNQENLGAVQNLCDRLNLNSHITSQALIHFKGIQRRLEILYQDKDYLFIDDYAQSAPRLRRTLEVLSTAFPQNKIKVFFESHASFIQYRPQLQALKQALSLSQETVIFKLNYSPADKQDRLNAKDYLSLIPRSLYLPLPEQVITHYKKTLKRGEILIHFSSGGDLGLHTFKQVISLFS